MIISKQLEFQHNNIQLLKESTVWPFIARKRAPINSTDNHPNPISSLDQLATPGDPDSVYNNKPEVFHAELKQYEHPYRTTSLNIENFNLVEASHFDKPILEDMGMPSELTNNQSSDHKIFLVRDKNTGDIVGGLSIQKSPTDTVIRFVEKNPDNDPDHKFIRKIVAHYATTPEGSSMIQKKIAFIRLNKNNELPEYTDADDVNNVDDVDDVDDDNIDSVDIDNDDDNDTSSYTCPRTSSVNNFDFDDITQRIANVLRL